MFSVLCASMGLLSLLPSGLAAPVKHAKRSVNGPVISTDFPDPSIINVGGTWYAFGTQSIYNYTNIHIQVASSTDFNTWTLHMGQDALPNLPGWAANDGEVWAPDVNQLVRTPFHRPAPQTNTPQDDGSFVMYFSATNAATPGHHCVGSATSKTIEGPYTAASSTLFCPTAQGGAIDAAGFKDTDGSRYITYKVDANSDGHGGVCNNGVAPIVNTPIYIQPVASDGVTFTGSQTNILNLSPADGPDIEAPSMMRDAAGNYILFFSSNCYSTPQYDVSYAYGNSPTGPFTKSGPLYVTGTDGLTGPGGADIYHDAQHMLFHALQPGGPRFLYAAIIDASGDSVTG